MTLKSQNPQFGSVKPSSLWGIRRYHHGWVSGPVNLYPFGIHGTGEIWDSDAGWPKTRFRWDDMNCGIKATDGNSQHFEGTVQ